MGNQHRDKIKQIYAQQGKILEDTLTNNPGSSQNQLFRMAHYPMNDGTPGFFMPENSINNLYANDQYFQ